MVKVEILHSRVGPEIQYKKGQVAYLTPEKAEWAQAHGWAKILESEPVQKIAPQVAEKFVAPTPSKMSLSSAQLIERFGTVEALKEFAKKQGIRLHWRLNDINAIAETIAEKL